MTRLDRIEQYTLISAHAAELGKDCLHCGMLALVAVARGVEDLAPTVQFSSSICEMFAKLERITALLAPLMEEVT